MNECTRDLAALVAGWDATSETRIMPHDDPPCRSLARTRPAQLNVGMRRAPTTKIHVNGYTDTTPIGPGLAKPILWRPTIRRQARRKIDALNSLSHESNYCKGPRWTSTRPIALLAEFCCFVRV